MNQVSKQKWQIFVDTGGTFTDCLGIDPRGRCLRAKVLSSGSLRATVSSVLADDKIRLNSSWDLPDDFFVGFHFKQTTSVFGAVPIVRYIAERKEFHLESSWQEPFQKGDLVELLSLEEPPILGARLLTKTAKNQSLPQISMRLGTTLGTNALLERKGASLALFVTQGFKDLLVIGNQQRPDLFALKIEKKQPLYKIVIDVPERINAQGSIILDLSKQQKIIRARAKQLLCHGIRVAAISLLNSYTNPKHEELLREWLLAVGFEHVITSSSIAPFIKILPRTQTTIVDAYLTPVMNTYLDNVRDSLQDETFPVMTSAGGLMERSSYRPKNSLLSGPAAGVVGAVSIGKQLGKDKLIAFDMGGTSTDVTRFHKNFEYQHIQKVGDAEIMATSLKIETVAAGGGSICGYNGYALYVGPKSASSYPGPSCYGAGGPLTITDVNLLLGRIYPGLFRIPISDTEPRERLAELLKQVGQTKEAILSGLLNIANQRMANAVKEVSVKEGYDPSEYTLVAFGGAGGMHACAVAEILGIKEILFPADAGLLSATGLKHARIERIVEEQVLQPISDIKEQLDFLWEKLEERTLNSFLSQGYSADSILIRTRTAYLRLVGQESDLAIDFTNKQDVMQAFRRRYESIFGYFPEDREVEVVSLQMVASTKEQGILAERFEMSEDLPKPSQKIRTYFQSKWQIVPVFSRKNLHSGSALEGPAIVSDAYSTLVMEPGWKALVGSRGTLRLIKDNSNKPGLESSPEVVQRELFTNRFRNIVEEMGMQLKRTALSTNVKERLDFSCALLCPQGKLVVNAPHIPVHLGAIGLCVRTVANKLEMEPGDCIITNHPGYGGAHLPDITLITPVFDHRKTLLGYVSNRAHHAEIGGKQPGSMPPDAQCLAEEGVVIDPTYLFKNHKPLFSDLAAILQSGPYPTRSLADNLADIRAQVAANRRGAKALLELAQSFGSKKVSHHMQDLQDCSAAAIKKLIVSWGSKEFAAEQYLDDGTKIKLRTKNEGEFLCFDFSGTDSLHPKNLNATPAIVHSAVIYFLRLLIKEDVPLNEGLLKNIKIHLPLCFLNPDFSRGPENSPPVVGGNVETSQRIVDTLLLAFQVAACGQGTMNNLVFGNQNCSYYETICGGAGAGNGFAGASAVHTHMTNTAITDLEILERRYPVRLCRFSVRSGSGGKGRFSGGEGVIREIEFLSPLSLSLLTQHRREAPYGMAGGKSGKIGCQFLLKVDGVKVPLNSICHVSVESGDRLVIATPGGGGYGTPV